MPSLTLPKEHSPFRNPILASPVGAFRTWHLDLHCGGCQAYNTVSFTRPGKVPDGTTFGDLIPRLRCKACRSPPCDVVIAERDGWEGREPPVRIVLFGRDWLREGKEGRS